MPAKVTTSEFIERAKSVHGDRCDYSKTFITSMVKNTTITCPIHGDFETRAANHLLGIAIVTGKQMGRASCRDRVSSPV